MKNKLFYTKYALRSFRVISLICAFLLICVESGNLIVTLKIKHMDFYQLMTNITNILALCFFIGTSIFPQKFGGLSFIAYIYAFSIIIIEPENYMGFLMYFLGTSLLIARGHLKKNKKKKLTILGFILILLCLTHLRFGFKNFINYFVNLAGGILVISLYTFFIRGYYANTMVYEDKKLNIASFPKLTERDCRILQRIQKGEKYSVIARDENITEGSLKNRLHFVFSTMETGDKQGFLSYYDDYELFFESEDVKLPESQEELQ